MNCLKIRNAQYYWHDINFGRYQISVDTYSQYIDYTYWPPCKHFVKLGESILMKKFPLH